MGQAGASDCRSTREAACSAVFALLSLQPAKRSLRAGWTRRRALLRASCRNPDPAERVSTCSAGAGDASRVDVVITGAGLSGLVLGRALQRHGISFVLMEATHRVGGVWKSTTHRQGAQAPYWYYELPEFPWPNQLKRGIPESCLPPADLVQRYIEEYAACYMLERSTRLSTRVTRVEHVLSGTGFNVDYEHVGQLRSLHCLHVAICTGFCQVPKSLPVQGRHLFAGEVIHACELTTDKLGSAQGKQVIVLGAGKSAIDASVAAAEVATSVTNVFRRAHYAIPLLLGNVVRSDILSFARLGIALAPDPYYGTSHPWRAVHKLLQPLKWVVWRALQRLFIWQQGLPKACIPDEPLERDIFGPGITENPGYMAAVEEGKLRPLRGSVAEWTAAGVRLQDGTELEADLVVQALGYENDHAYLAPSLHQLLDVREDGIHLYRNMLAPQVPGLSFIGSASIAFSHPTKVALQSEWLAQLLQGKVQLPSRKQMQQDIDEAARWRQRCMPFSTQRAGKTFLFQTSYFDQLMRDMGERPYRKGWRRLDELTSGYKISDHNAIVKPQL